MIQNLLGGNGKLSAASGDLYPSAFFPKIVFGESLRSHRDQVAVVGEFHDLFQIQSGSRPLPFLKAARAEENAQISRWEPSTRPLRGMSIVFCFTQVRRSFQNNSVDFFGL